MYPPIFTQSPFILSYLAPICKAFRPVFYEQVVKFFPSAARLCIPLARSYKNCKKRRLFFMGLHHISVYLSPVYRMIFLIQAALHCLRGLSLFVLSFRITRIFAPFSSVKITKNAVICNFFAYIPL